MDCILTIKTTKAHTANQGEIREVTHSSYHSKISPLKNKLGIRWSKDTPKTILLHLWGRGAQELWVSQKEGTTQHTRHTNTD